MLTNLTINSLRSRISRIDAANVVSILSPVIAIILTLVIVGAVVVVLGRDPFEVYQYLAQGAFGKSTSIATSLNKSVPLIFVALATAIAFRARIFNIGQEGQLQIGALAATWLALVLRGHLSPVLVVPLSLFVAALAGGIYGGIPGFMKAQWNLNEIITTIMLNYIAILTVLGLILGPMLAPHAAYGQTENIPKAMRLPIIWPGTRLHAGFVLALIAAVIVWFLLNRTSIGFEIRAMGFSPNTAKNTGMPIKAIIIKTMLLSGAFAGLAGAIQILGVQFQLAEFWSAGWGFTGIAVALLGDMKPLQIIFAGIFFGMLEASSDSMQALTGVPGQLVFLLEGLPVLFLMGLRSPTCIGWLARLSRAKN